MVKRLKHLAELQPALPAQQQQSCGSPSSSSTSTQCPAESDLQPAQKRQRLFPQEGDQVESPEASHPAEVPAASAVGPAKAQSPYAEIIVYSSRSAKDSKNGIDGYRTRFHEKFVSQDYEVQSEASSADIVQAESFMGSTAAFWSLRSLQRE